MSDFKYLNPEDINKLRNYEFGAKSLVEGYLSGRHRSDQRGSSTEFHESVLSLLILQHQWDLKKSPN